MLLLSDGQKEEVCKPSNEGMICERRTDKDYVPPLSLPKVGFLVV
jgi:hypothetical protein